MFYVSWRLWEAHLYVFYVSGRLRGGTDSGNLWERVGPLKKDLTRAGGGEGARGLICMFLTCPGRSWRLICMYFTCPGGSGRLICMYFTCPGGSGGVPHVTNLRGQVGSLF